MRDSVRSAALDAGQGPFRTRNDGKSCPLSLTAAANLLKVGVIFEIRQGWMSSDIKNLSAFVWSIAETLRGDFK